MQIRYRPRRFLFGILAFAISVAGCSPSIISHQVGPTTAPSTNYGVIYQLTKPQFTISTTQPSDTVPVGKYTLQLENVPDSSQRWGVRVEPGWLNEADISISLSGDGQLISFSESTREQITPTLKAIGDFAGSVLGAAAVTAGVAMDAGPDTDKLDQGYWEACELATRLDAVTQSANVKQPIRAQAVQYRDALKTLGATIPAALLPSPPAKTKHQSAKIDLKKLKETLKATTDDQRTALNLASIPDVSRLENEKNNFDTATDGFVNQVSSRPDIHREALLVKGEVSYAVKRLNLTALSAYSTRAPAKAGDNEVDTLDDKAKLLIQQGMDTVVAASTFGDLLGSLAGEKTAPQRIFEQAKAQQAKINETREKLAFETNPADLPALQQTLEGQTAIFHRIIGASSEYDEIQKLRALIAAGPPAAGAVGHSSPMQEFSLAHTQLTALQEAVTKKLAAVMADATEKPGTKPPEWDPKPVDPAFVINTQREQRDDVKPPPARLLKYPKGDHDLEDQIAGRLFDNPSYGESFDKWPNFVVIIEKVKP